MLLICHSESDSSSEAASFRGGRAQFWLSSQIKQIQLRHRRSKIFPGMSCFSALMIFDSSFNETHFFPGETLLTVNDVASYMCFEILICFDV